MERVRAEVARVDAEAEELRSRRAMLDELDDALVEAASESWQRVAAVEESSVGELRESVERIRALLEQADADGEAVRSRRGTVEELVEAFVERTREAGQRVGEVEEASVGELRAAAEQVRALMAQADADGEAVRARVGMVEQLVDGLVERTRDAGQRVGEVEESSVGELRESVERVRAELARIAAETGELRSRREQIQELDEQLVDALVEAASESWQRVAAVEERSVGELQGASERIAALSCEPKPTATTCSCAVRSSGNWSTRSPHVLVTSANAWPKSSSSRSRSCGERRRGSVSTPRTPTPRTTS